MRNPAQHGGELRYCPWHEPSLFRLHTLFDEAMIGKVSNFPFGGRMTTVYGRSFECWVSTAKEGILEPLSTMLLEALEGPSGPYRRPCAKIIYTQSLSSADRLNMHEFIVRVMDQEGEAGAEFGDIVAGICDDFRKRGVAAEAMHLV
ncbi:MAG: hypothetical protein QOD99_2980 [Chthoniobacter sp.]|nr:hypothetical protein [Chthoniobacter sp.]